MVTCPSCGSLSTIPIAYGKPGFELQQAASRGLVELGGCVIELGNVTRRCLDCRLGWCHPDSAVSTSRSEQKLSHIKKIVEDYLFPIHAGMVSSELFHDGSSHSASSFEGIYAYIQLKELLGIGRGCGLGQVASVQTFKKQHPDYYNQVIKELQRQICLKSLTGNGYGGLHYNLFLACALVFNASPMANGPQDEQQLDWFLEGIKQGRIGFE